MCMLGWAPAPLPQRRNRWAKKMNELMNEYLRVCLARLLTDHWFLRSEGILLVIITCIAIRVMLNVSIFYLISRIHDRCMYVIISNKRIQHAYYFTLFVAAFKEHWCFFLLPTINVTHFNLNCLFAVEDGSKGRYIRDIHLHFLYSSL